MNIDSAFPSKYLKASDLGAARPIVTIASVAMEEVGDDKLPVLKMVGKDKAFVLNRTNASMIAEIAGTNETEQWRGVRIQLYATKTDFGGKRVDCVRVEYPAAPGNAGQANINKPLPPMPAPLPLRETPTGWSNVAAPATAFLPPAQTVATSEPIDADDLPF